MSKKSKVKITRKYLHFIIGFVLAAVSAAVLSCSFAYFMTVKSVSEDILSIFSTLIVGVFAFVYSLYVSKKAVKQKGVCAVITLVITVIIMLGTRLLFPSPVYDSLIIIKLAVIVIGSLFGLVLGSSVSKKHH